LIISHINMLSGSFFNVCVLELVMLVPVGVIFHACIPVQMEQRVVDIDKKKTVKAKKNSIPKQSQPFRDACRMLFQNPLVHIYALLVFSTGPMWALMYQTTASNYASRMFGSPDDGDQLASIVVMDNFITCVLLSPVLAACVDVIGCSNFCCILAGINIVTAALIFDPDWIAQMFVAFVSVSMWAVEPILLGMHLFAHVSITLGGAAIMLFNVVWFWLYAFALLIQSAYLQHHSRTLNQMEAAMEKFAVYGASLYTGYFLHVRINGLPKEVAILPEIEKELCAPFACRSFREVGSILKLEKPTVVNVLYTQAMTHQLWASLVNHIDCDALRSQMFKLSAEELEKLFVTGAQFWRQTVGESTEHHAREYISTIGNAMPSNQFLKSLRNSMNTGEMGKGASKPFVALEREVREGTSALFIDPLYASKIIRETEIVIARIRVKILETFYVCMQVGIKFPDETTVRIFRFPAIKKKKQETHLEAIERMLVQFGMAEWVFSMHLHHDKNIVEAVPSTSYPGLFTRYIKKFVDVDIQHVGNVENFISDFPSNPPKSFKVTSQHEIRSRINSMVSSFREKQTPDCPLEKTEVYEWWQERDIKALHPEVWIQFQKNIMHDTHGWNVANGRELLRVKHMTARITQRLRKNDLIKLKNEIMTSSGRMLIQAVQALPHWIGRRTPYYTKKLILLFEEPGTFHQASREVLNLAIEILLVDLIGYRKEIGLIANVA